MATGKSQMTQGKRPIKRASNGRLSARWGLAATLCFVAATWVACSVSATEDVIPFYRQSQAAELKSPLDSVNLATFPEPKGFHLGQLVFNPYETEDTTYTDNSVRAEKNRLDDVLLESAAGFTSAFRASEFARFTLNYEFGYHDYELKTAKSYPSQQAGFTTYLDHVGFKGLTLLFTEQYLQTSNSSALENEIIQFTKYESNLASMRAAYTYNRFKISGEYAYSLTSYFDRTQSVSNFRTHGGTLDVSWDLQPRRIQLFESFQLQRVLFDHNAYGEFDSYTQLSGVRGSCSHLTYSLGVGYAFEVPLFHDGIRGNYSINGGVGYSPYRRLNFDASVSRSFIPDVFTGATLETDLTATAKATLTSRGKLSLMYTRNESDRLSGVQEISVAYSTRFDYKITRNTSAIFSYTRYDRVSTLHGSSFVDNEIRLGFKLAW